MTSRMLSCSGLHNVYIKIGVMVTLEVMGGKRVAFVNNCLVVTNSFYGTIKGVKFRKEVGND